MVILAAAIYPYQDIPRGSLLTGCLAETGHPPSSTGATLKEHQEVAGLCWPVSKERLAHKRESQLLEIPGRKTGPRLTEGRRAWLQDRGLKAGL